MRDTGNCSPRYMRSTINQVMLSPFMYFSCEMFVAYLNVKIAPLFLQIPCTSDLLNTSGMQLALLVQPLALPHPSEEPIQVRIQFLIYLSGPRYLFPIIRVYNHFSLNGKYGVFFYEFVQIVDFGEGGPVRCSRCKGYINPFMKFVDQGKRFICNFCGED